MGLFTTIASAAALAISATGAGMSFSAAAKAKRRAQKAAKEQKVLMASAKQKAEKDFYAGLNVPLDAFDEQYRQNIAANQQMIQQLQGGDPRNLAAGIGALGQATAEANEMTRIGMQKDLYANAQMKADSKQALNQQLVEMDVGEAADEAMRERDLQAVRAQHIQSGVANIGSMVSAVGQMAPLFSGDADVTAADTAYEEALTTQVKGNFVAGTTVLQIDPVSGHINVFDPNIPNPAFKTDPTQLEFGAYKPMMIGGKPVSKAQVIEMIKSQGLTSQQTRRLGRNKGDLSLQPGGQGIGGWGDYNWDFLYQ